MNLATTYNPFIPYENVREKDRVIINGYYLPNDRIQSCMGTVHTVIDIHRNCCTGKDAKPCRMMRNIYEAGLTKELVCPHRHIEFALVDDSNRLLYACNFTFSNIEGRPYK